MKTIKTIDVSNVKNYPALAGSLLGTIQSLPIMQIPGVELKDPLAFQEFCTNLAQQVIDKQK